MLVMPLPPTPLGPGVVLQTLNGLVCHALPNLPLVYTMSRHVDLVDCMLASLVPVASQLSCGNRLIMPDPDYTNWL